MEWILEVGSGALAIAGVAREWGMNANAYANEMDVEESDGRSGDVVMRMLEDG